MAATLSIDQVKSEVFSLWTPYEGRSDCVQSQEPSEVQSITGYYKHLADKVRNWKGKGDPEARTHRMTKKTERVLDTPNHSHHQTFCAIMEWMIMFNVLDRGQLERWRKINNHQQKKNPTATLDPPQERKIWCWIKPQHDNNSEEIDHPLEIVWRVGDDEILRSTIVKVLLQLRRLHGCKLSPTWLPLNRMITSLRRICLEKISVFMSSDSRDIVCSY
jgi:hypothetical protein